MPLLNWAWWMISSKIKKTAAVECWNRQPELQFIRPEKKKQSQKLDATEQDLARIEDLLFEINNQLKSLENQAKKAEKYFEIKKEYRELSIELAKASLEGFNITYRDLNEQAEAETDKRIELEAEIAGEEAAIEQEKLGFIEKEKAICRQCSMRSMNCCNNSRARKMKKTSHLSD